MFFLKLWLRFKWEELAFLSGRWFEWVTWPFVFFLNSWRRWSLFFWTGHIQYIHLKLISRPENWWLEDDCLLGNDLFSDTMFVLESVTISKKDHQQNFQGSWATRRTFGIVLGIVLGNFYDLLKGRVWDPGSLNYKFLWSCGPADIGFFCCNWWAGNTIWLWWVDVAFSIWKNVICSRCQVWPHGDYSICLPLIYMSWFRDVARLWTPGMFWSCLGFISPDPTYVQAEVFSLHLFKNKES